MNQVALCDLEIANFRSIRGRLNAPLDAKVVLIHGENGAGKTSLLSAMELALTGRVQALRRADPNYASQLLHRSAQAGAVEVRTTGSDGARTYRSVLQPGGMTLGETLEPTLSSFFSERCYLPQSLLGQLLQIYQESGSGIDSPLARFVGDLLGLDRLDALEAGMKPLSDVRNVRKIAGGWGDAEIEKSRVERVLAEKRRTRIGIVEALNKAKADLAAASSALGFAYDMDSDDVAGMETAFADAADEEALGQVTDRRRLLHSIRRESDRGGSQDALADELALAQKAASADTDVQAWRTIHGSRVTEARAKVEVLMPSLELSQDLGAFRGEALAALRPAQLQMAEHATRSTADAARLVSAGEELAVAQRQLATIDVEIGRIGANSSGLSSALAELTSYIAGDTCPVCDRDYDEIGAGPLVDHVHTKVRKLSGSAQRLLALSRSRGEQQIAIEALERELETLSARQLEPRALAGLARQAAAFDQVIAELEALTEIAAEGARLEAADVAARRLLAERQSRDLAGRAAFQTLREFAQSTGQDEPAEVEGVQSAASRLTATLDQQVLRLEARLASRRRGREAIASIRAEFERRDRIDGSISLDELSLLRADQALERGQVLRHDGLRIRTAVDAVRSAIIRREFNDRLNRLWRDLFVRLAPSEPFVPAFSIPSSNTQRLQPKLITLHRDGGDVGGTPGAMLSAGNLNTAALTLFMALHLSVPAQLPWLILDDPVQSMDDVHIAHFAALLRTLSKEHGRQVMIAVHDRQLFEYLKLELSPAYPDDSLLTLELSRGARRDTICIAERLSFQEETALREAA